MFLYSPKHFIKIKDSINFCTKQSGFVYQNSFSFLKKKSELGSIQVFFATFFMTAAAVAVVVVEAILKLFDHSLSITIQNRTIYLPFVYENKEKKTLEKLEFY